MTEEIKMESVLLKLEVGGSRRPALTQKVQPLVDRLKPKGDYILLIHAHSDLESGEIIYGRTQAGLDVSDSVNLVNYFLHTLSQFLIFFYLRWYANTWVLT